MKWFTSGTIAVLVLAALLIWMLPDRPERKQEVVEFEIPAAPVQSTEQAIEPTLPETTTEIEIKPSLAEEKRAATEQEVATTPISAEPAIPGLPPVNLDTAVLDDTDWEPPEEPEIEIDIETGPVEVPADRWVVHEIQPGDTLSSIFSGMEIDKRLVYKIANTDEDRKGITRLIPKQKLLFRFSADDQLNLMVHEQSMLKSTHYRITEGEIEKEIKERPVELRIESARGTINESLFADALRVGLSTKLVMQLANIFNYDIDFAREVREGDHFSVIYETQFIDGNLYDSGRVVAAEFVNQGKTYRVVRYEDSEGQIDYLNEEGQSRKKAFIRTPLNFTRISSVFSKGRFHPVLKRWRAHKGVDYAAPTGTKIWAAGNGTIHFIGRQRGYGKVIYIKHGKKYMTVYGHLNGFRKGLKKGSKVSQGDIIGYVGQTGLATGPHLHYEFRINGKHVDPLKHTLPPPAPITGKELIRFRTFAEPLFHELDLLRAPKIAAQQEADE